MNRTLLTHLLFFSALTLFAQSSDLLVRYPALNFDGSQVAFSWQGDIWTTGIADGNANRLTIHEGYETYPQWSPDGKFIAFQSNRFNNNDLYLAQLNGGAPKRLTYHSSNDGSAKWGKDGQLFFGTSRIYREVEWDGEIHQISSNGGTPVRTLDAFGLYPSPSPDGRYIAFARGSCRISREAYKGPANKDIWLFDTKTNKYLQVTNSDHQDIFPDWGSDGKLYFLSARSGRYNLYFIDIKDGAAAGEARRLTHFKREGIRSFDVSGNGQKVVFEHGTDIFLRDATGKKKAQKININVPEDYRFDPVEKKTMTSSVGGFSVSPNEKYVALSVRGEIVVKQNNKDKKRAKVLTNSPARDQAAQWLNDSTLLFISDRNGNKDIFMVQSTDTTEINLFKTFKTAISSVTQTPEDEDFFQLSPDRKRIAIRVGRGKLITADISEKGVLSNQKTLLDGWDTARGIVWSPDNQWLAYSASDLDFNSEIFIHAADNSGSPVNVSMHPRRDYGPYWSEDGSKLGFISQRNNDDADIWFAWLKKEDWEKTKNDWEEDEDEGEKKDKKKDKSEKSDSTEQEKMQIDFENIHDRLQQITSYPGSEGNYVISKDGKTFYFSAEANGRSGRETKRNFMSIKWDGSEAKTLLDDKSLRSLEWDAKKKNLYFIGKGKFNKFIVSGKKVEGQPFSAKFTIDKKAERAQVFEDAWRAIRDGFYDPNFHGEDWTALKAKYKKRALMASTTQDFRSMFNEMLGQLNASHMGLRGPNPEKLQGERTGLLGVEVKIVKTGAQITRIVANSPADHERSKLAIGEIITAVNGAQLTDKVNLYELLNGTASERTLLDITGTDGVSREVIIRPSTSLRTQRYENWIKEQKRLTDEYSNGQLGYIHIQGMNWTSFERFQRELMASGYGKKGIVIDVRYNGGGWTTDMLMAVLTVRQHAYTVPRGAAKSLEKENKKFKNHYPYGERLPFPPLTIPSVTLCNENSYSNAEIFSHAYKHLGLGTLVGQPTFGAVISTGGYGLMDGSFIRMPFRAWYVKATGENMEHGPAVPDVIVENSADGKAKGEDAQLKKAVEVLLGQLK